MKKIKIKGIKKEMSTTGTGASFTPGVGAQYATAKAFKKKKTEEGPNWSKLRQGQLGIAKTSPVSKQVDVSEPFTTLSPSIPNRKSKAIDYVKLFEKSIDQYLAGINSQEDKKYKKWNPVTDFTDSQANAGDNTGYDMDSQDAAAVSELAKFATKGNKLKVGDTDVDKGVKYTVTNIDKETGAIQWKIDYVPAYDTVYKEFEELRSTLNTLAVKTDDTTIDDLSDEVRNVFNRYRTHIRKNYPDAYKKFRANENIVYKQPEGLDKVAGGIPYRIENGKAIISLDLPDDVKERIIKRAKENGYSAQPNMGGGVTITLKKGMNEAFSGFTRNPEDPDSAPFEPSSQRIKGKISQFKEDLRTLFGKFKGDLSNPDFIRGVAEIMVNWKSLLRSQLQEVRYSRFKKEAKLRTPTEQIHRAVREIRQRMNEMLKIVGHTERMKNELKQSNEGMSYLKRTKNALGSISEKLQELTNRIKGLTE